MEPKRMFLESFCKGLYIYYIYIESFGRPSPLYPSLTPGNIRTLQCEKCCVHPWVKFEKNRSGNQFEKQKAQPLILVPSRNFWRGFSSWISEVFVMNILFFFWCFRKICCWKRESKDQYIEGRHLGYRVPTPSCSFVSFIEWSISKISGTYGK